MANSSSVCEKKVFQQLYFTLAEQLRNYFYYKCKDWEQAEDYLQESFIRLWNNCSKVPFANAKAFLYKVGTNLFLKAVAHEKVKRKYAHYKQSDSEASNQASPQFQLEEQEFKQKLERALDELTEAQREVFLMNRVDKLTYREIAERLSISQKAVEKRMSKALKALKEKIEQLR